MFATRKAGLGLALILGLAVAGPLRADDIQTDVDKAQATLTKMQQLFASIDKRQQAALDAFKNQSGGTVAANTDTEATTMKCSACGMTMTTTKTARNTKAVKIKGKTWYCCAGCNMSAIADKE